MKYKYTMMMRLESGGDEFEKVKVSVIATSGDEAIEIAGGLAHNDFELVYLEYISIEVI